MDSRFVRKIKRGLVNFKDNVKANVQDNAMTLLYIIVIAGILIFIIAYLGGFIPNIGEDKNNIKNDIKINKETDKPVLNNPFLGRYIRLERYDGQNKEIQLSDIKIYRLSPAEELLSSLSPFELSKITENDINDKKNGKSILIPIEAKNVIINPEHPTGSFGSEYLFDGQDITLTMTAPNKNASIEIDLGKNNDIRGIELKNRKDCCQEKLTGVVVKVISEDKKSVRSYKIDRAIDRYTIIERDLVPEY